MFMQSEITSFAQLRVGTIIDIARFQMCRDVFLNSFAAYIPLWFYWGPVDKPTVINCCFLANLRPTQNEIDAILSKTEIPASKTASSPPVGPKTFPPLPAHSRQRANETMEEFFARRQNAVEKAIAAETPARKQARLDLERTVNNPKYTPGRKSGKCFVWEKTDGCYIRYPITRGELNDYWGNYSSNQRHFNSVYNEWDLCKDWALDDRCNDNGSEDEFWTQSDEEDRLVPIAGVLFAGALPSKPTSELWSANVPEQVAGESENPPIEIPRLSTLMYERFGFIEGSPTIDVNLKSVAWPEILRTLASLMWSLSLT